MRPHLITENIWHTITSACKSTPHRSYVAVAYFGRGGARRLPLKKGSVLVVDASDAAVKAGQTSPAELLKLYRKGVSVYSVPGLHAKVYIIGTKLFIGSANVSSNAAEKLEEAVLQTTDRNTVAQAKKYVLKKAGFELGEERLKQLAALYRPPKLPGGKRRKSNDGKENGKSNFFICRLVAKGYSKGHEEPLAEGQEEARRKWVKKARHKMEEFEWRGKHKMKEGDIVVQITKEDDKEYVSPPGTVINVKRWKNGKCSFIFLEVPEKRRRNIESERRYFEAKDLKRSGIKNEHVRDLFAKRWK